MDTKELAKLVYEAEREIEEATLATLQRLAQAGVSVKDFSVGGETTRTLSGQQLVIGVHCDIDVDWRCTS